MDARRYRWPAAIAAAAVASMLSSTPASAHTALLGSVPAAGATVAPPTAVTLVFDESLDPALVQVSLLDERSDRCQAGRPRVRGGTVTQAVGPGLPAGAYRIDYRVVSDDGHVVHSAIPFTVAASAHGTAAPSRSCGRPTARRESHAAAGLPGVLGAAAVVVVGGLAWGTARRVRRR
ncbi:copper resistance protein CopC [Streptantibioticus rubrisoli]|uniref:Copper resistance protein CopC n=1 Tax=Streptantibioticus rubrisoli TaxID=1387313 RepID=A0ABT1PB39_9ACTN|nr:copper resistance protein CopC [Streptantibioticus rubrisoli]MCQ4041458.1 copper resistance protein CopC [Streptantibioticus rubrisoli]